MKSTFNRFLATSLTVVAALSSSAFTAQLLMDSTGTDINTLANWSTTNGAATPDPASFGTADQLRFNENTAATGTFTMDLSAALSVGNLTVDSGTAEVKVPDLKTRKVRVNIRKAIDTPVVSEIQVFGK